VGVGAIGSLVVFGLLLGGGVDEPTRPQGGQPGPLPITLAGAATDGEGHPLAGVLVRLYVGGLAAASTRTDASGSYALDFVVDPETDETMLVCWTASRRDLVPEFAIIRESANDRALGLWSPCVPRIAPERAQHWTVQLLDAATLRQRTIAAGCVP